MESNIAAWLPMRLSGGGIHIPGQGGVICQAVPAPNALRQKSHLLHSQKCSSECGGAAAIWQQCHEYQKFLPEGRACLSCIKGLYALAYSEPAEAYQRCCQGSQ